MHRKVLIVDDNEINRELLRQILGDEYEVLEADNGREALALMLQEYEQLSVILLDILMPEMNGYEVLERMRRNPVLNQIPVIVATGNAEKGAEVRALSLGANDFIAKPYDAEIIKHRLVNTINLREKAAIVNAIRKDALTGLYSRVAFFEEVEKMVAEHEPGYYVMACFDIENFKVINDQYGSSKGDEILKFIANVFKEGFDTSGGISCRIMADNYAVLYPKSFMEAKEIEEIQKRLSVLDGSILPIGFSIGRYIVDDLTLAPSAMYDRASIAMASVKGRFDKSIAIFDESMRKNILYQQEIISEMEVALENAQFEVWFQPQYNHASGALIGAEALVRWIHPQKGMISPGEFIPIFEKNGFIYEVDKFVWEQVCIFLRKWMDEGNFPLPISVNISRYDIFREDIVDVMTGLIKKYCIPVDLLRLEITESAFAQSSEQIIRVVKELKQLGFIMEIDDFGSGYSSLNTLKDVPADVLKLDMRFLEGEENNSRGGSILESIVRMTKWLGMWVIAEGVETLQQADYLKSISCNYVQGYFYAKPMPMKDYERLAKESQKEKKQLALEMVDTLNNEAFWNPNSIETLIFNSYVGGASVFEYYKGEVEVLRVNDKYVKVLGGGKVSSEAIQNIDWEKYADEESRKRIAAVMKHAIETGSEVTDEVRLIGLWGPETITYLRTVLRVIARTEDRYLFYCMLEDITAQRKAEQREAELFGQLQAIMDNVACGVTATNVRDGKVNYLFVNNRYYEMLGYIKQQYEEEISDIYALIHSEDRKKVYEAAAAVRQTGLPVTLEYRMFCRDGREIWVKNDISITRFKETDEPVQLGVYTDITAEMLAEKSLRENDEHLQFLNKTMSDLMNDTPGGFVRMHIRQNAKVTVVYVNKGFCDLLGSTESEVMAAYSKNPMSGIHPEDIAEVKKMIRQMLVVRGTHSMKFRMLHKCGEYRWFLVFGRVTVNESGDRYLNIYYSDISEQNRVAELRRELIENLPCGAGIYEFADNKISVIYLNTRYRELMGRKIAFEQKDISTMSEVRDDERKNLMRHIREAIAQGKRCEDDVHMLHGSGEYRPFHLISNIVQQKNGRTTIYATYTPISEEELAFREMLPVALSAVMSSSTDLSFVKDKNLSYICCSRAFANMVGLMSEKDIVGKTDYNLFEKELADKYRQDDNRLMEWGESLIDYVEHIPSEDGIMHYSSTSKYLLKDSVGNVIGLYGVGRDITQSREAYARLKLLTDTIPGGLAMYAVSPENVRTLYLSDGVYCISGYSKEEYDTMTEQDVMRLLFEEDRTRVMEQIRELIQNDIPMNCTYRILSKSKGYRWINMRGTAIERNGDTLIINTVLFDVTEQKDAELKLEASNSAMNIASQNGGISFWLYDLDKGTISHEAFGNKSALGFPSVIKNVPNSLIQRKKVEPEDGEAFGVLHQEIQAGADKSECTVRLWNEYTRRYEWRHIIYTRLEDTVYKRRSAIGFAVNVDLEQENWQRYEHELQLRQELVRNSLFYYQLNLTTGVVEEYHSKSPDIEGMKETAVIGEELRDNILKNIVLEDVEKIKNTFFEDALIENYRKGRKSFRLVYRRKFPGQGVRWVETVGSVMEKPNSGEIIAFIHCRNIDVEKKNQLAIETIMDEEIESVTVLNVPSGMAHMVQIKGDFGGIAMHEPFEFDLQFGKMISKQVIPEDQKMCESFFCIEGLKRLLAQEPVIKLLYRIREENGKVYRKNSRAFYLDDSQEEIVLIRRDITDLYKEEQRQQQILQKAIEAANAASQAKSDFLSHMSHDMRTPLNAVLSFSDEEMINGATAQQLRAYLDKIHISGDYLLGIINDVLDMSKIEQKKVVLNQEPYLIEQFVKTIRGVIEESTRRKGIEFILDVSKADSRVIRVDKVRFNQIFVNLLSNAVKFTPEGGRVEFMMEHISEMDGNRSRKRFTVRDNGIGMSPEFLPHAFESFKQEYRKDTYGKVQGTGLGLTIVNELVNLMGGTISVESELGRGTVFTVELPLETVMLADSVQREKSLDELALTGLHVLLAEDNAINMEIAVTFLRKWGCIVDWAENGKIALEKYCQSEEGYYHIVLMDIRMPVMDGLEAAQAIRESKRADAKTIPILAMTADAFNEEEEKMKTIGMSGRLFKPVEPNLFYKAVREAAGR